MKLLGKIRGIDKTPKWIIFATITGSAFFYFDNQSNAIWGTPIWTNSWLPRFDGWDYPLTMLVALLTYWILFSFHQTKKD